jgi:glycosyltransferase involved in cell wall biosynthesis
MLVAIPSKGRAGNCPSADFLTRGVLYVPETEADAYRAAHPDRRLVAVPAHVRGITSTRNWILNSTNDPWVVMVDDDVRYHGTIVLEKDKSVHRSFDEQTWLGIWHRLFETSEGLGSRIWGVGTVSARWQYRHWRPFILRTYVLASCMGIRNDTGIRFDERFTVKEDYEICLRCLKEDGIVVAARFAHWENRHWTTPGGCTEYRTTAVEDEAMNLLAKMYPGTFKRMPGRGGGVHSIKLTV